MATNPIRSDVSKLVHSRRTGLPFDQKVVRDTVAAWLSNQLNTEPITAQSLRVASKNAPDTLSEAWDDLDVATVMVWLDETAEDML